MSLQLDATWKQKKTKSKYRSSVCFIEAVVQTDSVKKGVLRNFGKLTGKHLCQSLYFIKVAGQVAGQACNFIKMEILAEVFSCEFCKNTFS